MIDSSRPWLHGVASLPGEGGGAMIRLDCNESPFDLPPAIKEAAVARIRSLSFNRYPDVAASAVAERLAASLGVRPAQIVLGHGLDEVILMLLLAFGAGKRAIIPVPGFGGYRHSAAVTGVEIVGVPLLPWLDINLDRILDEAKREPGLVFVCDPHNPTGRPAPEGAIERILEETRSLVVVDEAYWEFSGRTCVPLLKKYDRLIVLRTFSKALGLAGIRLGYAVSSEDLAARLSSVKQPYNVSSLSLAVAEAVLDDTGFVRETVSRVVSERERLSWAFLAVPGVVPFPSSANFILIKTPRPENEICDALRKEGIYVRVFPGEPLLSGCIRVTVGKPDENDAFLRALSHLTITDDRQAVIGGGYHA